LIGSDYGLIDYREGEPNPDYYATLIFRGLVGDAWFRTRIEAGSQKRLRRYAFAHRRRTDNLVILLINLRRTPTARLTLPNGERPVARYTVSADGPRSARPHINGLYLSDFTPATLSRILLNGEHVGNPSRTTLTSPLPPLSYTFVIIERS
jgi:heparanase 1